MSTKNARTLSIRLDAADTASLQDFEGRTGIDGVTLGRNALRACIKYFQAGGTITFPLVLRPAVEYGAPEQTPGHQKTTGRKPDKPSSVDYRRIIKDRLNEVTTDDPADTSLRDSA